MLAQFSVTNFKGFNSKFIFNLNEASGYTFNNESVDNGIVKHSIIYGQNGVGKSNLGLAIFDLVRHLTDLHFNEKNYSAYLNALNENDCADFHYEFLINSEKVTYIYSKSDYKTIFSEEFYINDKLLVSINRAINNNATVNLKGAENLKKELENPSLSILKYIRNNTVLDKTPENEIFSEFYKFIDGLLFFRSLNQNTYIGLKLGVTGIEKE